MGLKIAGDHFLSVDPLTGETIASFSPTPPENMPEVVAKSRTAFRDWSQLSLATRIEIVRNAYGHVYRARDEIAQLISRETGKPLVEAYSSELLPVLDCFKYYLKNIKRFLKNERIQFSNPLYKLRRGTVVFEPLGIVAVISPWNFPFLLSMQHIVPALLCGNAVVHKPSEYTSLTGLKIRELFDRAYLPRGVLTVVTGLSDVGQALVSADLEKIFFTGSTTVGTKVYQAAAKNLVPVNMELGGNDPMIVLEDANITRAVNAAVWGALNNCGQACVSVERLFVHERVYPSFVDLLKTKIRKLSFRNGAEEGEGDISCLSNENQLQKIRTLLQDAVEKGASILAGGTVRQELGSLFLEPTILENVDSAMQLVKDEIFGPLLTVIPFMTDDEAIYMANDSQYGLSASIWTQNPKRAVKLAKQIESGSVLVNEVAVHVAQIEAPYVGYKRSGVGVSHGRWEIAELVSPKYINTERRMVSFLFSTFLKRLSDNDLWWFKYGSDLVADMRTFLVFLHDGSFWNRIRALPAAVRALLRKGYL